LCQIFDAACQRIEDVTDPQQRDLSDLQHHGIPEAGRPRPDAQLDRDQYAAIEKDHGGNRLSESAWFRSRWPRYERPCRVDIAQSQPLVATVTKPQRNCHEWVALGQLGVGSD